MRIKQSTPLSMATRTASHSLPVFLDSSLFSVKRMDSSNKICNSFQRVPAIPKFQNVGSCLFVLSYQDAEHLRSDGQGLHSCCGGQASWLFSSFVACAELYFLLKHFHPDGQISLKIERFGSVKPSTNFDKGGRPSRLQTSHWSSRSKDFLKTPSFHGGSQRFEEHRKGNSERFPPAKRRFLQAKESNDVSTVEYELVETWLTVQSDWLTG